MRALQYFGPDDIRWNEVEDPKITAETDAIVRVDTGTICGTDLHILKGHVPTVPIGGVLGHEAVGTVMEVGTSTTNVKVGDRVIVHCVSACGKCRFCKSSLYSQCLHEEGGWVLGNTLGGTQAQALRVPFADNGLTKVPGNLTDEQVLYLSDILCTGYEVGVLNGQVKPGDVVVIVGAGPIGLSTILAAKLFSPAHILAVDLAQARRDLAISFGANSACGPEQAEDRIAELTEGLGADVVIEAVGIPATLELCFKLVRPAGRVSNIGVHGEPVSLPMERLWATQFTLTTGIPHMASIPPLLRAIASGDLDATRFTTHRFPVDNILDAYEVFKDSATSGAVKIVLETEHTRR